MYRRILLSTLAALLLAPPAGALAERIQEGEVVYHTVVRGDTLWDISESYFEDPFKWPELWKRNPYIKNPHLIYPGDVLKITPDGIEMVRRKGVPPEGLPVIKLVPPPPEPGVEVEGEIPPVVFVEPPPPIKKVVMNQIARDGFISTKELEDGGVIVGSKAEIENLHKGELAFVSFANQASVKVGDRFTIYTVTKKVRHPVTNKHVGSLVTYHGSLVVTARHDEVFEARIDTSYREILVGTRLMEYREPETEIEVVEAEKAVTGVIIAALEGAVEMAEGDIVFIDKGERDGLVSGNIMGITRKREAAADPYKKKGSIRKKTLALPPTELGSLIVIEANEETSSAIVIDSLQTILRGDRVQSREAVE
jgi:LysM repeat protein